MTLRLKVIQIKQETSSTTTLFLEPINTKLKYQSGQFLTFIFKHLGHQEIRRSYSFSSTPGLNEPLAVTVKNKSNGLASRYLSKVVKVGEVLNALPPAGQFILPKSKGKARTIFLIGGGSGITPLFSILKQVLHFEPESKVVLINANTREEDIIFRQELQQLTRNFPKRLHVIYLLSNPREDIDLLESNLLNVQVLNRRLSNFLVEELVEKQLSFEKKEALFFICGPRGLMLKSEMTLRFMGFEERQIFKEIFVIKTPLRPEKDTLLNSHIKIKRKGEHFYFDLQAGQTILEAAEKAAIPELPFSCRSGICTTCAGICTKGKVEMYTQEGVLDTEKMNGLVMTCVGYPITEQVEIDFDR